MTTARLSSCVLLCLATAAPLAAQQIDLSLHPTAVPDSFEVRATSTGAPFDGFPGAVFTIRWEIAAGGVMDNGDVHTACDGYSLINYNGTEDFLGHRYFTLALFGERFLHEAGCAITSEGMAICGFRIRELSGCRNVELIQNAFTDLNNLNYYFSINGADVTGGITSGPLSSGDCPPCVPPVITTADAGTVPYCGFGVDPWAEATGTTPDYAWYGPGGIVLGWLPQLQVPSAPPGTYTVVVSNACGADTAQVEAVVDTGLCVPPLSDSAWFHAWTSGGQYNNPGIQLNATSTGSCLTYAWTMPWGEIQQMNPHIGLNVWNPTVGNYTLVTSNACGSDTLVLFVGPPTPCIGPLLSNVAITVQDSCHTGHVVFNASVGGPGPFTSGWYSPDGMLITGSPHFSLPFAPWGTYSFVASNACTTDTVSVFHGPADTTGLAACEPPQILSLSTVPMACLDDTVQLIASTLLAGPCASLIWSGVEVLSTHGDTTLGVLQQTNPMVLTATNGCGQAIATVPIEVVYPEQISRFLCDVTSSLSLDSIMHDSFPFDGGQWMFAGTAHGGTYDPAADISGLYQYYMNVNGMLSCDVLDFQMHVYPGVYAGEDSSIVVCTSDPPFPLFNMIGGEPETPGHWSFNHTSMDDEFDPATSLPGVYTYFVSNWGGGNTCSDEADITVAVTSASVWYADADSDGLGDPADTLLACAEPAGYVDMAGDDCPNIPGIVGDPCDDGNPQTGNDMLTADCTCAGELATGIAEQGSGTDRLWPSPNWGDAFFVQTSEASGQVRITMTDATGRKLLDRTLSASSAPVQVVLPANMVAGTYFVNIVTERQSETKRLVVAR